MTLSQSEPQKIYIGSTEIKAVYKGDTQIRPSKVPALCFTANTAGSKINMTKVGSPTNRSIETSTDGNTWTAYTFGTDITLTNVGDKVYWRSASDTDTGLSTGSGNYYKFVMTGSIKASGDVMYLLNKNGTTTLSNYCFLRLFTGCTALTQAPELPATTLSSYCYSYMFYDCTGLAIPPALPATTLNTYCYQYMFSGCSNLEALPVLPAITMKNYCYRYMFQNCSKIKLSSTQTGDYQTAYRIPTTGTGTTATTWNSNMFSNTGGTFTGAPTINTTYYTSNTVV